MREICYCGRTGELEDRMPVTDRDGRRALECPECGHLDHLSWLPEDARQRVFAAGMERPADERSVPAA
jgi:hypothetical protein